MSLNNKSQRVRRILAKRGFETAATVADFFGQSYRSMLDGLVQPVNLVAGADLSGVAHIAGSPAGVAMAIMDANASY